MTFPWNYPFIFLKLKRDLEENNTQYLTLVHSGFKQKKIVFLTQNSDLGRAEGRSVDISCSTLVHAFVFLFVSISQRQSVSVDLSIKQNKIQITKKNISQFCGRTPPLIGL